MNIRGREMMLASERRQQVQMGDIEPDVAYAKNRSFFLFQILLYMCAQGQKCSDREVRQDDDT
jgi:pyrroloquinoline quinone (PQQ) biosynthesis protein C